MISSNRRLVLALTLTLVSLAPASAQVGVAWVHKGGQFKPENGNWVEYLNGQKAFTFTETGRGNGWVGLYDPTRGIRVTLSRTKAEVSSDGKVGLTYLGGWHWTTWARSNSTFKFVDNRDGTWTEWQDGKKVFYFTETGRGNDRVLLYDASRGFRVELIGSQAKLWVDGKNTLTYNGRFTR